MNILFFIRGISFFIGICPARCRFFSPHFPKFAGKLLGQHCRVVFAAEHRITTFFATLELSPGVSDGFLLRFSSR